MDILKFDSTSVANAGDIKRVRDIINSKANKTPLIAVVSAFSGVTNLLEEVANLASNNKHYKSIIDEIDKQHKEMVSLLFKSTDSFSTLDNIHKLIHRLKEVCHEVSLGREPVIYTSDHIYDFGELLSSQIISDYLKTKLHKVTLLDPAKFLFTKNGNSSATNKEVIKQLSSCSGVNIFPGCITSLQNGQIPTFGRGRSDYTAAILAGVLDASALEIWTDVDGLMTADPKIVKHAHAIEKISYEEAMELSHFGTKVVIPSFMLSILKRKIPIHIKNTFKPNHFGTLISADQNDSGKLIKGLISIKDISLISLKSIGVADVLNLSCRLFKALSSADVEVMLITQVSSEHAITIGIRSDFIEVALEIIEKEFELEMTVGTVYPLKVKKRVSIIIIVGNNIQSRIGVSSKIFDILGQDGINIVAIAQSLSECNLSIVIDSNNLKKALNSLHEDFSLSDAKSLNVFIIGVGNIGAALIDQIKKQQTYLYSKYHLDVKVVGLANSRKMCFDSDGILLDKREEILENGESMQIDKFIRKMSKLNLRNSVFVDNTSSEIIASTYTSILSESISIVTPNKVACSSSYSSYEALKKMEYKYRIKFLFETNVGAGLPVISTLNDMIKSGDEILEVQGVLSGSLNFVFNSYNGTRSFADILRKAKKEGYTEPDPRLDVSGKDVMRKLLILAREVGNKIESDEIKTTPCVPESCMKFEGEAFFDALEEEESYFKNLYDKASKNGEKIRYVAQFNSNKISTQLMNIASDHPFYYLEGKDNIVSIKSRRYFTQPLVVKGAGAGAEVTASGVFSDIIKTINS